MPAAGKPPSIAEFRDAARKAMLGYRDPRLSLRTGGGYDITQGTLAVQYSRQAQRDRGLFERCYVETSRDVDRDRLVEAYYRVERVPEAFGAGVSVIRRPTASGSGTVYTGTPIEVTGGAAPTAYVATSDVVFGTETTLEVPVRAARSGWGVRINTSEGLRFGEGASQLEALGWTIESLRCDEGTDYEQDDDYLARARTGQRDRRVGHIRAIVQACKDAGAYNVVALHAGTFGESQDVGINYVYVSDPSFQATQALKDACMLALEGVRVGGCDTQVLGMQRQATTVAATVYLYDDPSNFDQVTIAAVIRATVVDRFMGRSDWWIFRTDEIRGAIQRADNSVQSVEVFTTPGEPAATFPAVLNRYTLSANDVTLTFAGPQ
jgi:hypothetical protein